MMMVSVSVLHLAEFLVVVMISCSILIPDHHNLSAGAEAAVDIGAVLGDPLRLVDCQPPPAAAQRTTKPLAPALYVLGDSLLDSGNNNLLPTLAKANYPPYGESFTRCPTGRFTNGRTVADFLAEFMGLPYPPPFVAIRTLIPRSNWNTSTGFNYASGSCGILKDTGSILGKCLSLEEQIDLLNETINETPAVRRAYPDPNQLSTYLSNSIFVISVGNNDYINDYFESSSKLSSLYDPERFSQLLIAQLSQKLQKLYNIGARKIVLFDVGPIGCLPNMARRIKHDGQCVEEQNRIISFYNAKVPPMLASLRSSLPGSHFVLGRAHDLGLDAILNPSKYGLKNSTAPCCTSWNNNTLSCVPGLPPCTNPDEYFFWDAYHLTQAVYSTIAARCISGSDFCTPLNIQQLLQV